MLPTRNYSGSEAAVTQRPTSSALLVIDSEDRYENYTIARAGNVSPYDFTINTNASLMNGFFTRLALTEVVFPWTIPNVNVKTNKIKFVYAVLPAGIPITTIIELPIGFYTPAELAAAIQLDIASIDPPNTGLFLMTYSGNTFGPNTPTFEYSNPNVATVSFQPMTPGSADWPYGDNARQLFDVMGFSDENIIPVFVGIGGATFAQASRYVDIVCAQLTNSQSLKDTGTQKVMRDALVRLYIVDPANIQSTTVPGSATFAPPGTLPTTIYRNYSQPKQIQWLPNQPIVGSLRFQVYDDEGDILTITEEYDQTPPSRANWSISLLVSEN